MNFDPFGLFYQDESRVKVVCVQATPVNHSEYSHRLIEEIEKMAIN